MTTTAIDSSIAALCRFGRSRGACQEALDWLKTQPNVETAWQQCERPNWMFWLVRRRNIERKTLVRIACECARTALRFVPEGEDRPRLAIEATERWCDGTATIEEVRSAYADAAYAAADARREADIKMCNIVRAHISLEMLNLNVAV